MATCFHCKTEETQLFENGVPICLVCANTRAEAKLDTLQWAASANGNGYERTIRNRLEDLTQG